MRRVLIWLANVTMLKDLFNYFRPTIEGEDGKSSWRRVTIFTVMFLVSFMIFKDKVDTVIDLYLIAMLLVFILILGSLMTVQQLINFTTTLKFKHEDTSTRGASQNSAELSKKVSEVPVTENGTKHPDVPKDA